MPITDQRQLLFDLPAIRACLQSAGNATRRIGLPSTELQAVAVMKTNEQVELSFPAGSHFVAGPQMAALLIAFCAKLGIPIPRGACKKLEQSGSGLKLLLTSDIVTQRGPAELGGSDRLMTW